MKKYLLLLLFIFPLFLTSCDDDDDDLQGDWWKMPGMDSAPMKLGAGFVIGDKFYIGTGIKEKDDTRLKTFYSYDKTTEQWTRLADFGGIARTEAVGFAINGKGYIGLGYDGEPDNCLSDFWEYDPSTDTWKQIENYPEAIRSAVAFSIGNKGYVGTGKNDDDEYRKTFYSYDSGSGWQQMSSCGTDGREGASAFVINNVGYVVGGTGGSGLARDMWEYKPESNTWTEKRKITNYTDESFDNDYANITRRLGCAFVINGKGYLACGGANGTIKATWEYDPSDDTWEERTSFEGMGRFGAVGFSFGGDYGYIVSGGSSYSGSSSSSGVYYSDMWAFDPTLDFDEKDSYVGNN